MSSTNPNLQASKTPYRVLMVTGVYPTEQIPHSGTFIKTQVDSLVAEGLEVEVIHPNSGQVPLRYISAAVQVFLKTLTGHFDIVNGYYGLWCLAARMQWTTPVVATYIGGDLLGELYADGGSRQKSELVVHASRWLCYLVDSVIVKSEGMKKAAPDIKNIFVIPDGVDFALFHPIPRAEARAALGWDPDRYYILFSNNPRLPSKNYPLARAAIERLTTRGISAELVVANGLPQTRVVQYMNASNALILPSIYEGSPNVVKEAMACNIPVVTTDVGDISQVIGHTRGCTVCPGDPDALAEALEQAIQFTGPTTGRKDISHLECSVVAKQIIAVYEQIKCKKA